LVIAVSLCNTGFAQDRPKQVDTLVKNLQKRGIDTILIYMQGAVWHYLTKPVTAGQPSCHCSFGNLIYSVNVIYKDHGKVYKLDYACCKETDTVKLQSSVSIPYFLVQKKALRVPKTHSLQQFRRDEMLIPTDYPFEDVELITSKKDFYFELDSYQSTDGYKIWKKYPWINKQIRLIKLIRRDLNIDKQ